MPPLTFLVPGSLEARTGGTRFDVRLAGALSEAGVATDLLSVPGVFPGPDAIGARSLTDIFSVHAGDRFLVVDGLCLSALAMTEIRSRFVALVHHPADLETGLAEQQAARLRRLEMHALTQAARIVVTSTHTADLLASKCEIDRARIGVVAPGVSVSGVRRAILEGRQDRPLRLLSVASVTPRKGHDVLIRAIVDMRGSANDLPAFNVDCFGSLERDRAYAAMILDAVDRHRLGGQVVFHGEVEESVLIKAYQDADIFVHPAHYEGYGMAVADALACGIPVVATAGGAVTDLVTPEAGLIVAVDDSKALAATLLRLLGNDDLRQRLASGAARRGAALSTWSEAAERFVAECRKAML